MIRAGVRRWVDTALAAVDVAAVVYTVRRGFARRHVLAEARRHLLETLRGHAFPPALDGYIADQALARHSRQLTVPQEGRRIPAPDQITCTADLAWPRRWFIADTDGRPPGGVRARWNRPAEPEVRMTDPTPPRVTPEYLQLLAESLNRRIDRLEELADAARLRGALYPAPQPPSARRRRSREYPGGRPNPWRAARLRRHRR